MIITVTLNPAIDRILEVPGFRACPERRREAGRTLKARVVAVVPAGKGVNVSRYLAALGVPSVAAGFVGARERAFYEESLAGLRPGAVGLRPGKPGARVTPAFVSVDAPTRTNTTILAARGGRETHIREEGFAVSPAKRAALASVLDAFAREGNTFVFAGSLPKGFPVAEFSRLIRRLGASGARVAVDASGPALSAAAAAGVDLLSPNEDELRELMRVGTGRNACPAIGNGGADIRVCPAMRKLLCRVGAIAVKRGAKGGRLLTRDGTFSARATLPPRRVRNTVGAGDAFLAGFLAADLSAKSPVECLRWAVAAGAAAVVAGIVGTLDLRVMRRGSKAVRRLRR